MSTTTENNWNARRKTWTFLLARWREKTLLEILLREAIGFSLEIPPIRCVIRVRHADQRRFEFLADEMRRQEASASDRWMISWCLAIRRRCSVFQGVWALDVPKPMRIWESEVNWSNFFLTAAFFLFFFHRFVFKFRDSEKAWTKWLTKLTECRLWRVPTSNPSRWDSSTPGKSTEHLPIVF